MAWIQSDINYSPSYVPCEWSTGTDEEIVEALEKHYAGEIDLHDYWAVGDARQVTISGSSSLEPLWEQTVTYVLSNVGGKYLSDGITECCFQVDQVDCLSEEGYIKNSSSTSGGWKSSARRTWCNNDYKNAIPSTLRSIFKEFINQSGAANGTTSWSGVENTTDTFALRAEVEIFGSTTYSVSGEGSQITWYTTSSNRIKKVNNISSAWWERSPRRNDSFCMVFNTGEAGSSVIYDDWGSGAIYHGIAPFGVI